MTYRSRIVDQELATALASAGFVLIEGAKATGKTETARRAARSEALLDVDEQARIAAALSPDDVLEGAEPRLIDEWQLEPRIWDHVRRAADARSGTGHFILTGSSQPQDDKTRHTGALRMLRILMRPMSLAEVDLSSGDISLRALLDGATPRAAATGMTVPRISEAICTGGWPRLAEATPAEAQRLLRTYIREMAAVDVQRLDGVRRDPRAVMRLVQSLARLVGNPATIKTLARDMNGQDGAADDGTVSRYLDALARLHVTEDLEAWSPTLQSKTRLRTSSVRYFVDPSLAVAALRASPERLRRDWRWFGFLFENMVVRDLRIYAQAIDAQVLAYRDELGLEADAIVELADGRWGAFEVKLGSSDQIEEAAASLLSLRERLQGGSAGEPAALGVIVPGGYGYRRDDGVSVIPVSALAP
jgi:uncharacterized protein